MPELCEVQIMTENLERWLKGKKIRSLEVLDDRLNHLLDAPVGEVYSVWRRAKYSIVELEEQAIVLHYRMTGQVVLENDATRFVRLRIHLEDETSIAFVDRRKFGQIEIVPKKELTSYFATKKLGAEIWPMKREGKWWQQTFANLKSTIKMTLLKQDRVVGIGNILASEFCFAAQISPFQSTDTISMEQWNRLAETYLQRLEAILNEERSEKIGYLFEGSGVPSSFQVYSREGEPCPNCGDPIQKQQQSGRATYWCATCQPLRTS